MCQQILCDLKQNLSDLNLDLLHPAVPGTPPTDQYQQSKQCTIDIYQHRATTLPLNPDFRFSTPGPTTHLQTLGELTKNIVTTGISTNVHTNCNPEGLVVIVIYGSIQLHMCTCGVSFNQYFLSMLRMYTCNIDQCT